MLWGANWWDALSAIGTVGAVVVALGLAWAERKRARRAEKALEAERTDHRASLEENSAAMVSAWVEMTPVPSADGVYYERHAVVHVANESDRPVYNANVCVGIQNELGRWTPVGQLAVPLPLPVLASRSRQTWDITLPLLACSMDLGNFVSNPTAAIAFSDHSGQRWMRNFDLALTRQSGDSGSALFAIDQVHGEEQIGQLDNPFNPIGVVVLFLKALSRDEGPDLGLAKGLLDPSAKGWARMGDDEWADAAQRWGTLGVAAHVHYPAPRIAYVKTLTDDAAEQRVDGPGYVEVPMTLFTLRYIRGVGWRIFSVGWATRADMIAFPEGDLLRDVRAVDELEDDACDASGTVRLGVADGH